MPIYPRYHGTVCTQDIDCWTVLSLPPVPQNDKKMGSSAIDMYSILSFLSFFLLHFPPKSVALTLLSLRMLDNHTPSLQPTTGTFPQATRSPQYVPDQEPSSAPIHDPSLTPAPEYDPPPRIVFISDQPSSAPIVEFLESAAPIYDPNLSKPPPKATSLNIAVLPRMKTSAGDQYTGLRSLSLFTLQLIFFLVLTIVAILAFAGVLELNTNNWGNFPIHYRGIQSDLGDYAIAMAPGAAIALPWLFLRTTT